MSELLDTFSEVRLDLSKIKDMRAFENTWTQKGVERLKYLMKLSKVGMPLFYRTGFSQGYFEGAYKQQEKITQLEAELKRKDVVIEKLLNAIKHTGEESINGYDIIELLEQSILCIKDVGGFQNCYAIRHTMSSIEKAREILKELSEVNKG